MILDGLAVRSRLCVPSARAAALHFGQGALLRLPAPPVTGSMPETQAVNVGDNAVRSESGPLPCLPSFYSALPPAPFSLVHPLSSQLFITEPDVPSLCYF